MQVLTTNNFRFSNFELDGARRLLLKDGEPVTLNPKAFDLLFVLVQNRGEVLSKEELLERVWPGQFVEEGNLKVHISALRKAFGERKNEHRFIVTVPGRGYSFVADLEVGLNGEIVVESHTYSNIVVEQDDEILKVAHPQLLARPTTPNATWVLLVSALSIVALAGCTYWYVVSKTTVSAPIKSVAVMPFVNDSGNADLEYLSDGLTESLIGSLSQLRDISVKGRTSISRYKGKEIDLKKVGAELSVESIVTGRFVRRGDELTLYVEFVEPSTGNVFWKADYRRHINDIAALDKEISRDVATKLKTKLSGEDTVRLQKYQTENSEAYELYLRGVSYGRSEVSRDRLLKSISCFEQAVKIDPNYTSAYIEMAWSYIRLSSFLAYMSPQDTFPKAREALLKAIAIDENFSATHNALATYYLQYEWNWPAAEREFERALELDPDNAGAYSDYRNYYDSIGRFDEAIRVVDEGRKLLPGPAPNFRAQICNSRYLAGHLDEAFDCYRQVMELSPKYPWSYLGLGRIHLKMKNYSEAVTAAEKGVEFLERNPRAIAILGHIYAKGGRIAEANKIRLELESRSKTEYVSPYYFALLYAGMDDRGKVFDYLEKAIAERQSNLIFLNVEPLFDDLRRDPRFEELVNKIGIPK